MCAPSSNCSHQSAHNTTLFLYVLLFPRLLFLLDRPCRDGPPFTYFSRHFVPGYCHIVPAGTALPFTHFSRHFVPGYGQIVPAGTALPFTHFSRHFVPGYCHIVPCGDGSSLQRKIVQPRFQPLAKRITSIGSTPCLGGNRHAQVNQPFQVPDIDIFRIDS